MNGFMLDPSIGEFVLTDPDMRISSRGSIYSVNEGHQHSWGRAVAEYVRSKKQVVIVNYNSNNIHPIQWMLMKGRPYGARYIGSMVADVHRTLKVGLLLQVVRIT